MNQQRQLIYQQRQEVLDGEDMKEKMLDMIDGMISSAVSSFVPQSDEETYNYAGLRAKLPPILVAGIDFNKEENRLPPEKLTEALIQRAHAIQAEKEEKYGYDVIREIERIILLRNVDKLWMDHLDAMTELKGSIGLNAYAQRNPIVEFKIQGSVMFDEMIQEIRDATASTLLSAIPRSAMKREQVAKITGTSSGGDGSVKKTPVKVKAKVGPNDPCPCGSGKKYKKCCGLKEEQ